MPGGCSKCVLFPNCGGIEQPSFWGCFETCVSKCASSEKQCDWVCPHKPDFVHRVREVGSLTRTEFEIRPLTDTDLPSYIPMIRHGSRRKAPLREAVVGLSLKELMRVSSRREIYEPVVGDPTALRKHWGLRADAKVLVVCVTDDTHIERYWRYRKTHSIPEVLAKLEITAITVPNFSFFSDAPQSHNLWNRQRMLLCAEELSKAGLQVIPHIHAISAGDWAFWASFLTEHSNVNDICFEFQTGAREEDISRDVMRKLALLKERVARPLRLVAVGGRQYAERLEQIFGPTTVVDSRPFMQTVHRREMRGGVWRRIRGRGPRELSQLLRKNIEAYRAEMNRRTRQ